MKRELSFLAVSVLGAGLAGEEKERKGAQPGTAVQRLQRADSVHLTAHETADTRVRTKGEEH